MKFKLALAFFILGTDLAGAQGTFVYDQQETNIVDGTISLTQQPLGQSFAPSFSSVDFAEFYLAGGPGASGAIQVDLFSGSIIGTLLARSASVDYTGTPGFYDFLFPNSITLNPGTKYFLQVAPVGGSGVGANITFLQYSGGDAIYSGTAHTDRDFWFREGTLTQAPEPSSAVLLVTGLSGLFWHRVKSGRK